MESYPSYQREMWGGKKGKNEGEEMKRTYSLKKVKNDFNCSKDTNCRYHTKKGGKKKRGRLLQASFWKINTRKIHITFCHPKRKRRE